MTTLSTGSLRSLFALSTAFLLAACTLPTKLGELTGGDDGADGSDTSAGSDGAPTTTGADTAPPIDSLGDDSGSDSSGADSNSGAGSCTPVELTRTPVSPNVVLVLDKSGSMFSETAGTWDHDNDPNTPDVTRWSSLHQVVDAIATEFEGSINLGAHLFPSVQATAEYSAAACVVDEDINIAVATMNRAAILAGIPAADEVDLRGGTPITAGISTALAHLKTLDPDVPRAILLVTDGAANCAEGAEPPPLFEAYDESVHDLVADAFTIDGIPTYVVGVGIEDTTTPVFKDGNPDEVNTFTRLNELATDGGRPKTDPNEKFFNTVNQSELAAALDEIAVDTLTCIIDLDSPAFAPEQTAIAVDGMLIPKITDCGNENGWIYTNPDGPFDAIELCGTACGGLKITGEAQITVCTPD